MKNDPDIWRWFDGEWKVHCPDKEVRDHILSWTGARQNAVYYIPDGSREWDVLIPTKLLRRAKTYLRQKIGRKIIVET